MTGPTTRASERIRVGGAVEFEQAVELLRDELMPLARDARHLADGIPKGVHQDSCGVAAHEVEVHRGTSTRPARLRIRVEYVP